MSAHQMHLDDDIVGPADEDEILAGIFRCRTPVYYDYKNAEIREFLFRLAFKRFKDLWLRPFARKLVEHLKSSKIRDLLSS